MRQFVGIGVSFAAWSVLVCATSAGCAALPPDKSDCVAWRTTCPDAMASDASFDSEGSIIVADSAGQDGGQDGPSADDGASDASDGALCSPPATLACNGTCVDPTQPAHCGSCTNACPAPASGNGSATCSASDSGVACGVSCLSGYHACNGDCLSNSDVPSTATDPCVVSDDFGVFVAPGGKDTNAGTMAQPVATLGHAFDLAKASGKRVYACGGTYSAENLVVGPSRDGVAAYGGLDCSVTPWKYDATKIAVVAPSMTGYAMQTTGLASGVTFEDFAFQAKDASVAGASSITVFLNTSSNVVFRRSAMTAGAGVAGQDQTKPPSFGMSAPVGSSMSSVQTPNPNCPTSIGGAGAKPTGGGAPGSPGQPGPPNGNTTTDCSNNVVDDNGAPGASGGEGAGATTWGALGATGWAPASGAPGGPGAVGQGGGGGASLAITLPGGGGGGAGGCGGTGGTGGTGGGSSIALLVYHSSLDLESCTLKAGVSGRGGNGAAGQDGQLGGTGGMSVCAGGAGGAGGPGGGGGGGAGGVSAGIVWTGTSGPSINGTATPSAMTLPGVTLGATGAGGQGGAGDNGGKAGIAQAVLSL